MKLTFTVLGEAVGKNRAVGIDFAKKLRYVRPEMRAWQRKVAVAAWVASIHQGWVDPFMVKVAGVFVQRFNMGGDYDRGTEYLFDALEITRWPTPRGEVRMPGPIGLVSNDKFLWNAGSPPTIEDDGGARTEITVTLESLHSPDEANRLRERWEKRDAKRTAKKKAKANSTRSEEREIERRLGLELFG